MIDFDSFPSIETKNLLLRKMDQDDAQDFFEMRSNPRMNVYTDSKVDENIAETKSYIDKMNKGVDDRKWLIWAIEHNLSKKVIGSISIWNLKQEDVSGELGYGIIPDFQGQGFMKESLLSVIDYAFEEMKLNKLFAYTEEENENSIKLLEKSGFAEINRVDEPNKDNTRLYRMVVYRLERP